MLIDSFQFLSSSLGDNWKNIGGNYFTNLSQEFESEVSELVKKKKKDFISLNICAI